MTTKKRPAVRPTNNGRSSLEELKKKYDKVLVVHRQAELSSPTGRTTVLLVSGDNVFVGVAKFSNRGDTYSRPHGRIIAQGRAELAASVFFGDSQERISNAKRREELSYVISATPENSVQNIIDLYLK